ncbi:hypothetical protein AKJ16_DCAP26439 [Drosera capensis]
MLVPGLCSCAGEGSRGAARCCGICLRGSEILSTPQKPNSEPSLTFKDVSKFFSFPLSEAADILGVSTSTLKTICNENGRERWPQRKYLAEKSIEELR